MVKLEFAKPILFGWDIRRGSKNPEELASSFFSMDEASILFLRVVIFPWNIKSDENVHPLPSVIREAIMLGEGAMIKSILNVTWRLISF